MTYTALYANRDTIARKLKGRLKIDIADTEFFPVETVDEDLIDEILEEKENYINAILGGLYTLPFNNTQPLVKSVVENLVMADLLQYNYVNSANNSQDLSNLANLLQQKADDLLDKLTKGTPINPLPDGSLDDSIRLKLNGETSKRVLPETALVNNDTWVDSMSDSYNDCDFLYSDKAYDNLFSADWRNNNTYGEDY
jgi:phage gp36-like protein